MEFKNISVIGSGTMGNGIAHVFALNGYKVTLIDIKQELVDKALNTIKGNLDRQLKKEVITQDQMNSTLANIGTSVNLSDAKDSELIVEAATENLGIKKEIFKTIDSVCKTDAILASNTSSISITEIQAFRKRADKVIGMHFMNPVPMMKLIEVIRGLLQAMKLILRLRNYPKKSGKRRLKYRTIRALFRTESFYRCSMKQCTA